MTGHVGAISMDSGLAYEDTSQDARETPATTVIVGLLRLGAHVRMHDTHVAAHPLDNRVPRVALTTAEVKAADAVVLVTDHDDVDYELVLQHASYVFDTRHRLTGDRVEHL